MNLAIGLAYQLLKSKFRKVRYTLLTYCFHINYKLNSAALSSSTSASLPIVVGLNLEP